MANLSPYTFKHTHLQALEARALGVSTDDEARKLADAIPDPNGHIATATYNPRLRRIEAQTHPAGDGRTLGIVLPIGAPRVSTKVTA